MEPYKDTFSKIKFRGSFGLTGNDQLDGRRFAYQTTLGEDGTGYDWGTNDNIIIVIPALKVISGFLI